MTGRRVPLLDLQAQLATIRPEVLATIERVVDSQKFILGEEVSGLEEEIAAYSQCRYAVGCASGSDALLLALMAYDIGPGDEVLTVPYTFFATVGAVSRLRATPVLVDIDADTFNMNVDAAVEALRSRPNIKAVIPVHLFGACADMDPILAAARDRGVPVIEDAAQSIGSEYKGRRAGSMGDIGCFSFFPSKNLGAFGDAGMCTAADAVIAAKLRALSMHGSEKKYYHEILGFNSRLDALQAAILRVKLRYLDAWSAGRQRNTDLYRRLFTACNVPVILPRPAAYQTRHIYNQFVIRAERRDELQSYLKGAGIGTEIYYPLPVHLQQCFADLGYKTGDMPVSEKIATESLALPIYPELQPEDIEYVVATISAFYAGEQRI
jgi:dTDP-4-amino-4,6-dideoxygalactose transaminase